MAHLGLCRALGRRCTIAQTPQLTSKAEGDVFVDQPSQIRWISKTLATLPHIPLIFDGEVCVFHILIILRWISGMEDIDYAYSQSLDDGVAMKKGVIGTKMVRQDYQGAGAAASGKSAQHLHSTLMMMSAAYVVLLIITKGLNRNAHEAGLEHPSSALPNR